jgi:CheY-like chemotaxis protein
MKLRAYLVDDEPLALDRLRRLLDRTGRVEVIGVTTSPESAVAALTADPPDVCFLDIQMPRLNGFEVLARLPTQPIVVFTTAYDQYALKAFGVNSVDYLLKPIEPEALDRALNKVERLRSGQTSAQPDLQSLLTQITGVLREVKTASPRASAIASGFSTWTKSPTSTPKTSSPGPSPKASRIASTTLSPSWKRNSIRKGSPASTARPSSISRGSAKSPLSLAAA